MADFSGWHPDPGGARGRFRYWDGKQWSAETTDDPSRPPPGAPPAERPRRSRRLLVAAAVAGLVVLVLIGLVVRNFVVGVWPVAVDPMPPPTVIGNDSPTPTPEPSPTPTATPPSVSPSPTPRSPSALVPCPLGLPNLRAAHPIDDRVYGGNLSFPAEPSYRPATEEPRMTFAFDVIQQQLPVNATPAWIAQLAVGQLRAESGFVNDAQNTAESLLQCLMTGSMYSPYQPSLAERRSEATDVSGKAAWLIEADVTVTEPGLPFPGDRVMVVVVPDGIDWGFFFGAAPIGDVGLNQILDRTVAGLQAT